MKLSVHTDYETIVNVLIITQKEVSIIFQNGEDQLNAETE